MPYVMVEVDETAVVIRVNTYGPYETHGEAEQARRRKHFDNLQKHGTYGLQRRRTFVSALERGRA